MQPKEVKHLPDQFGFRSPEASEFPQMVVCGMSFVCNARCIHCPNAATNFSATLKGTDRIMSREVFNAVADQCAKHPHCLVRLSSAGEILTHPNALELIEYLLAVKTDKNVALTTNGALLTADKAERLLKAGIRSIEISVDAADKKTYEAIRVGLNYETLLKNVTELVRIRDAGNYPTRIMVSVIEQDLNRSSLTQIHKFWDNLVDVVLVRKLLGFGGLVERTNAATPYMPTDTPCPFLWERVLVDPAGNVRGCVNDIAGKGILGNVLSQSIGEIWKSTLLNSWRDLHLAGKRQDVPLCENCVDLEYRSWEYNYFHALNKDI